MKKAIPANVRAAVKKALSALLGDSVANDEIEDLISDDDVLFDKKSGTFKLGVRLHDVPREVASTEKLVGSVTLTDPEDDAVSMLYVFVANGLAVMFEVAYPEYSDDETDGSLHAITVFDALGEQITSRLGDVIASERKEIDSRENYFATEAGRIAAKLSRKLK